MPEWRLGRHRGIFCAVSGSGDARRRIRLFADRAASERELHRLNNPRPRDVTVAWIWREYLHEMQDRPVAATMRHTAKALLPHFGDHDPETLTVDQCRSYVAMRRALGRADGTIHTELGHLRTVLSWAVKRRLISHAPHVERPAKPPPRDRYLTRDEATRLIEAAGFPHVRLAIILLLGTAARVRALLDLTWDRCDFERSLIMLRNPDDPASRKRRATVPMNGMVRAALSEARAGALTPWVIEWAGKPVRSIRKGLATAASRAGVAPLSAHVLRHTAAVWMAEAGTPMAEIAQYLGHRDSRVTEAIYARFSPDHLRRAADALDLGVVHPYQRTLRK